MKRINVILTLTLFIGVSVFSCTNTSKKNETSNDDAVRLEQYVVQGQQLYTTYCANCHQADGSGLADLYPPLKGADYMDNRVEEVTCQIRYGLQGEIVVNGKTYNQMMPGLPNLTDLEVTEIVNYIYNSWGRDKGLITLNEVKTTLENCSEAN